MSMAASNCCHLYFCKETEKEFRSNLGGETGAANGERDVRGNKVDETQEEYKKRASDKSTATRIDDCTSACYKMGIKRNICSSDQHLSSRGFDNRKE